jgi:zinc transport system substrate-binding protein
MMNRRQARFGVAGLLLVLGAALLASSCRAPQDPWNIPGGAKHVLVSFPPLYCFAANVAGPDAKVLPLLTTVGPHDYQPTAADALKVRKADLFLVNGLELDEFIIRLKDSSGNRNVKVVEVGEAVPESELLPMDREEHSPGAGHHHHGDHDPHVWLGLPEAVHMVQCIRDQLSAIDPEHKDGYTQRAAAYVKELEALREHGRKVLAGKKNPRLIATHESLRYFARSFGKDAPVEIVGNIQVQPNVPLNNSQLTALARLARKDDIRVIAIEPQFSEAPKAAAALKREMGDAGDKVQVIEIDPLETVQSAADLNAGTYVRTMKANIDTLAKALR